MSRLLPVRLEAWLSSEKTWLALLIVGFCAADLAWILADQAPMANTDAYIYAHRLLGFFDRAEWGSPGELWSSILELSHGGRPPLYQVLTLPFVAIFGRSEDSLLIINILLLALLMVSTYHIGRLAGSRWAGLLAAALVVSYSPVVQISRMYMPHFALIPFYALSVWLMLRLAQDRSVRNAWWLCAALAATSLIHPNFFTILAPTVAIFSIYTVFFDSAPRVPAGLKNLLPWVVAKLRTPFVLYGLLPAALLAAGIALFWYLNWGTKMLEAQQKFLSEELSTFRGYTVKRFGFLDLPMNFWWYARSAPGTMSSFLALGALAGLVFGIWKRRRAAILLAGLLIAGYVAQSFQANLFWMYIAPILPVAAALTAVWLTEVRPRWLSRTLTVVCLLAAFGSISIQMLGIGAWGRPIAVALGSPIDTPTCKAQYAAALCPTPPQRGWPIQEILETVLADPECQERTCSLMVVNHYSFVRGNFVFEMRRKWGELPVKIHSHGVARLGRTYPLAALLRSDFLTWVDVDGGVDMRSYRAATAYHLRSQPPSFAAAHQTVATFESPTGEPIRLLKRTAPLTVAEATETIDKLVLLERYKAGRDDFLASLRAVEANAVLQAGDVERATELFEQIVADHPKAIAVRIRLAHAYRSAGRLEEATSVLEQARELEPNNARLQRLLASTLRAQSKDLDAE